MLGLGHKPRMATVVPSVTVRTTQGGRVLDPQAPHEEGRRRAGPMAIIVLEMGIMDMVTVGITDSMDLDTTDLDTTDLDTTDLDTTDLDTTDLDTTDLDTTDLDTMGITRDRRILGVGTDRVPRKINCSNSSTPTAMACSRRAN